jgi:hypothetical protein
MSLKKCHTFIIGIISLLLVYFATLLIAPGALQAIGPAVVMGIVGACGFYQGANVADNWQRSKYYREELSELPTVGRGDSWQKSMHFQGELPSADKGWGV